MWTALALWNFSVDLIRMSRPQERHNELVADYGRQVRVADIARAVQQEAAASIATAHRSAAQVGHYSHRCPRRQLLVAGR